MSKTNMENLAFELNLLSELLSPKRVTNAGLQTWNEALQKHLREIATYYFGDDETVAFEGFLKNRTVGEGLDAYDWMAVIKREADRAHSLFAERKFDEYDAQLMRVGGAVLANLAWSARERVKRDEKVRLAKEEKEAS